MAAASYCTCRLAINNDSAPLCQRMGKPITVACGLSSKAASKVNQASTGSELCDTPTPIQPNFCIILPASEFMSELGLQFDSNLKRQSLHKTNTLLYTVQCSACCLQIYMRISSSPSSIPALLLFITYISCWYSNQII